MEHPNSNPCGPSAFSRIFRGPSRRACGNTPWTRCSTCRHDLLQPWMLLANPYLWPTSRKLPWRGSLLPLALQLEHPLLKSPQLDRHPQRHPQSQPESKLYRPRPPLPLCLQPPRPPPAGSLPLLLRRQHQHRKWKCPHLHLSQSEKRLRGSTGACLQHLFHLVQMVWAGRQCPRRHPLL